MTWFKVDDNLAFHHKVVAAGNAAMGMWVRAGSLCANQLTDGFVPDHMIASLGGHPTAKKLVATGLWDRVEGGYQFHQWSERQPSKGQVEADRAAARERQRKAREAAKAKRDKQSSHGVTSSEVTYLSQRESRSPRPDPTRPITSGGDGKPSATTDTTAQDYVAEWIDHCIERPPSRVIGQVSKELKQLVADGISPIRIRTGLAEWHRKGLHPATLASVVHETRPRPQPVDWMNP